MTWSEKQVLAFDDKLKLDTTRAGRVTAALTRFEQFCATDAELKAAKSGDVFLQGSVATGTVIRPLDRDEFDVDAVYPFHLNAFPHGTSPTAILDWFIGRLSQSAFYRDKLIPRDRCARIDYAGDFHVDIIPATQTLDYHQPYAVPAKDLGSWVTNDPLGFANWVHDLDTRSGGIDAEGHGRFVRSCRMAKRWRDAMLSASCAPSSILLVTMLGKHDPSHHNYNPPLEGPLYPKYQTDIAYLYDMLRLTHSCLQTSRRSAFIHPTIKSEDLGRGWDQPKIELFLQRLSLCIECLRQGIYAQSETTSLEYYRKAFGDTFPAA